MDIFKKICSSFNKKFPLLKWGSIFCVVLIAASCSGSQKRFDRLREWMKEGSEIRVLSSIAQIDDLVMTVGGDAVKSLPLVQGDLDPHSYELVKGDNEKFVRADVVFYNGLNLEHGASLSAMLHSHAKAISIGDAIARKRPDQILEKDGVMDPHLWMDVSLWSSAIDVIVEALSKCRPEKSTEFYQRGKDLKDQMLLTHQAICEKIQTLDQHKRYLLTTHDAFRYFARAYFTGEEKLDWQNRFAAPEGLAPDGQIGSSDIQDMISFLQKNRVQVIFPESNLSKDSIRKIAAAGQDLGFHVKVCEEPLYGDSMSNLSYLEMMTKNADIMMRYLQ